MKIDEIDSKMRRFETAFNFSVLPDIYMVASDAGGAPIKRLSMILAKSLLTLSLFLSIAVVLCLSPFAVSGTPSLYAQPRVKAIVGGILVNTNGAGVTQDSIIVIEGNRIVRVGRSGAIQIPEGAEIIDAKGKWIIPGLIDGHVHFFQSGGLYTRPDVIDLRKHKPYEEEISWIKEHLTDTFARYIRSGVTSAVDVGGPFWNFEVREKARDTAMAPRVAVAGPLISTYEPGPLQIEDPPIVKADTPEQARILVRQQAERRPDLIKIWFIVRPGQKPADHLPMVRAAIEESHEHGIPAVVHATELETARAAVEAGADILAHGIADREVDEELIRLLKRNNVIYTPTLMVSQRYDEVFSQQIDLTDPERKIADPYILSTLSDLRRLPEKDIPPRILSRMTRRGPVSPDPVELRNLKRVHDAGVTVAVGTDAGNIGTPHGPAIFRELDLMARAGLSARQILTAATINGARLMGRREDLGTVEQGKLADMVLLNSDPLADIRNTSDIHLIVKDGNTFEPDRTSVSRHCSEGGDRR